MSTDGFPAAYPLDASYDFVVIGGGLAGISAAVMAARLGLNVALVQDRPVLGGNASSEHHVPITGANTAGSALARYTRETGIVEEFMLENLARNPLNSAWVRDTLWWELVKAEPNLTVYLNAQAQEAVLDAEGKLMGCTVVQSQNERHFSIGGALFADCSGDGRIGADAGAAFRIGREGRAEFGESMAPDEPDAKTLPTALLFRARRTDHPVPFVAPDWAYHFSTDEDLPFRPHRLPSDGGSASSVEAPYSFWWVSIGGDWNTIADAEKIHDTLLPLLMGIWDHLKNGGDHGVENYALEWISPMGSKRESRRFEGDSMPSQNDVMARKMFDDRVAYAGRSIDIHVPEGLFSSDPPYIFVELPFLWPLPYSALYSRNIDNLFFAGRNMSVSHVAFGSTRVMSTLATAGQAVGAAAYLCARDGLSPRQVRHERIDELQQILLRHDCYIPEMANHDPADLALGATVRASSEAALDCDLIPDNYESLAQPLAQMVPVTADRLDTVSLLLRSKRNDDTTVCLGVRKAAHINDFSSDVDIASCEITVSPGTRWVSFDLGLDVDPDSYYWVWLPETEGVAWAAADELVLGTNRAFGGELGDRERVHWGEKPPTWFSRRGTFMIQVTPESMPYQAANVINGVTRPAQWTNAWVADGERGFPQWIDLDFGESVEIDTVQLTFDSNLDISIRRWPPNGIHGAGQVPDLVRDYVLYRREGRGWIKLLAVEGNYQRQRIHRFGSIETDKLRLEVLATNGAESAKVFEMRAYGPLGD